jgi:D-arabinose 5-phosphate isomerase GutQ
MANNSSEEYTIIISNSGASSHLEQVKENLEKIKQTVVPIRNTRHTVMENVILSLILLDSLPELTALRTG